MKYPLDTQNLKGIFMYILILRAVIKYAYLSFVNKKGEPIIALLFLCCLICICIFLLSFVYLDCINNKSPHTIRCIRTLRLKRR